MVSIAIISDIMPLIDINRVMVISGLKELSYSTLPFALVYKDYKQKSTFTSEDIAFGLAPLLNSAGRLEDASLAVEFITSQRVEEASTLLHNLVELNESRKDIEQHITKEAISQVNSNNKVLVVSSKNWHEGVVGIVASRLKDKFKKPAIVLNQSNEICKGSGRSTNGLDLFGLMNSDSDLYEKFGGHSAAVGLSIMANKLDTLREYLDENYDKYYDKLLDIDEDVVGELSFAQIDFELIDIINRFEPYGESNSRPKFITRGAKILAVQTMGKDKNHLRFTLEHNRQIHQAVQFNTYEKYDISQEIDILYKVSVNEFRGDRSIQLMLEDVL